MEAGQKKKAPEVLQISSDDEDITVTGKSKKSEKEPKSPKGEEF